MCAQAAGSTYLTFQRFWRKHDQVLTRVRKKVYLIFEVVRKRIEMEVRTAFRFAIRFGYD